MYTGDRWMYTPVAKGPWEGQAAGRGPEMLQLCGRGQHSVIGRGGLNRILILTRWSTHLNRQVSNAGSKHGQQVRGEIDRGGDTPQGLVLI